MIFHPYRLMTALALNNSMTIGATFFTFYLAIISLITNSSYFSLYFIAIFWSLLLTAIGYFCLNINFSQMIYFYIICLYLKLKLRNANNSIRKSFDRRYKMSNHRMKNILRSLDSIISEINTYFFQDIVIYCGPLSQNYRNFYSRTKLNLIQ